jgi:tripartite-type tricarboxylate transporter receptor subunit TctC
MSSSSLKMWVLSFGLLACAMPAGAKQSYPSKPITLILPYAPGGSTSTLTYLIREKLTDRLGQQFIVHHRPGASATIGAAAAAKAAPDGHTIVLVTTTHVISPMLFKVPYDALGDFAPITPLSKVEVVMVAHPSVPVTNMQTLVDLARARPGQVNYATASAGSPAHLAAELFSMRVGIQMQSVAYKGGAPAVSDLLGGQVELMFGNPINVVRHISGGRLRGLAISGERRLPALAQVPTFGESGLADFDVSFWQGMLAPAGTPKEIVHRLAAEIGRVMVLPDIKDKLARLAVEPYVASPQAFEARMRADRAKYAEVIEKRKIKIK